ncbi:hypothetical protein PoB_000845700 [Plakobranchus ocellatus]|uniref:Uncharacterized protein n=1 Tax=Plakobranchus ocellatus TaxID=259542 RepID=A0AAV3YIE4_9GAST|nr:hypothetical protein PoB_000845700 [Plakobranchus ocellatus]
MVAATQITVGSPGTFGGVGLNFVLTPTLHDALSHQSSSPAMEPNQGDMLRRSPVLCYTPSRGCRTSTGIDPSPSQRKMISRLGSMGQRCPSVSGEESMLMSDSHYCQAVTTLTSRIHSSLHMSRTSWQTRCPH